jgi:hypothetical protein
MRSAKPFEHAVGQRDALLGQSDVAQVASAGRLALAVARSRRCRVGPVGPRGLVRGPGDAELQVEGVEGRQLVRELQLELGRVESFGLGDEEPTQ